MSMAAPATRAVAGQSKSAATQKAFFGRAAAGSKASVADAFSAMSLSAPTKARGLSICGAYPSHSTRTTRRDPARGEQRVAVASRTRPRCTASRGEKPRPYALKRYSTSASGWGEPTASGNEGSTNARDRDERAARPRTSARCATPRAAHPVLSPRAPVPRPRRPPSVRRRGGFFSVARRKSVLSCSFLGHDSTHRPTTLPRAIAVFFPSDRPGRGR